MASKADAQRWVPRSAPAHGGDVASRIEFQPLITVTGDTTSGDVTIVQPLDLS
ncbi:MAG: hypothetical protein AB7S68_40145 [Polyangiaceae bacterium]